MYADEVGIESASTVSLNVDESGVIIAGVPEKVIRYNITRFE